MERERYVYRGWDRGSRIVPTVRFIVHGSHTNWKTWKMGEHFPVRQKSGNFTQNPGILKYFTQNSGILGNFYFCP